MSRRIVILGALIGTACLAASASSTDLTHAPDTLQRELTLQRDYVPEGRQAQKAYFNPLDRTGSRTLKPIEFARNTYGVSMNVTPKLFDPIANPLFPERQSETFSVRLFGGYPARFGANIGALAKVGTTGTFQLVADHASHMKDLRVDNALPFTPQYRTHDTDINLGYTHALQKRLFTVTGRIFHNQHSFYGQHLAPTAVTPGNDVNFDADYPLYTLWGLNVGAELSPAPLSLASAWQYSLFASMGYTSKQDPLTNDGGQFLRHPDLTGYTEPGSNTRSELSLRAGGNLAYGFSGTDWSVGLDALYNFLGKPTIDTETSLSPPQLLSLDPYVQYSMPGVTAKAGARIQLLNRGGRTLLITPDIQLRWQATDKVSLLLNADGGGEFYSMKEIYEQNRFALGSSSHTGYRVADYRVMAGFQLGNFNGFSLDLRGGYEHYRAFSDWGVTQVPTLRIDNTLSPVYSIVTPLFALRDRGEVSNAFFGASVRYVSPMGLDLSANIRYNSYNLPKEEAATNATDPSALEGLPSTMISLVASYQITDKLSVHADFQGEGGIFFLDKLPTEGQQTAETTITTQPVDVPFLHELNARVSYKAHKNIGFSLMGNNLLNNRTNRWLHYQRPGTNIVAAVTVSF